MILPTATISSLNQGSHDCETIKEKAEALEKLVCVIGTVLLCHDCLSCNDAAKTLCLKVKAKGAKTKPKPKAKVEETVTVEEKEDVDKVENPPPRILPNKMTDVC